jgi:hypothetical protein
MCVFKFEKKIQNFQKENKKIQCGEMMVVYMLYINVVK